MNRLCINYTGPTFEVFCRMVLMWLSASCSLWIWRCVVSSRTYAYTAGSPQEDKKRRLAFEIRRYCEKMLYKSCDYLSMWDQESLQKVVALCFLAISVTPVCVVSAPNVGSPQEDTARCLAFGIRPSGAFLTWRRCYTRAVTTWAQESLRRVFTLCL